MRLSFYKPFSILVLIFTLLWLYNSPTLASSETKYYFGLKGAYHYPGGDFDGKDQGFHTIVQGNWHYEITYDLHELTDNYGAGVTFGAYNQFAAGEISYSQSKHDRIWQGIEQNQDEAVLDILNIDLKFFQPNSEAKRLKPYGQIGLVISTLSMKNCVLVERVFFDDTGSEILRVSEIGNARYTGMGYTLGFGLMLNITENLLLDSSVIYQKIIYDEIKTLGIREEIPGELSLTTSTFNLGLKYCF